MAGSITHKFVSTKTDKSDTTKVRKTEWNDEHNFSLSKSDVGLTNVDNTSDVNKPISTAVQSALDLKSNSNHNHNLNDLTEKSYNSLTDIPSGFISSKIKSTPEGGIAVRLTNKTGIVSVKGYCVCNDDSANNAVKLVPIGVPNCIGVLYEDGIADSAEVWVVISGIADVYFWDSTTRGQFARTGLATDTGEVAGQALSEAVPTAPFATDKHFCEIGHVLETRSGAGLAKVILHFN